MEIPTERIAEALAAVTALRGREVRDLAESELVEAHQAAAHLARLSQVPQAVLAAEIARRSDDAPGGGMARKHGHRNATGMVAKVQGGSGGQARDAIVAGGLFGDGDGDGVGEGKGDGALDTTSAPAPWPHVRAAVEAGGLSLAQARTLIDCLHGLVEDVDVINADMSACLDELEQRLVARALVLSVADLRRVCLDVTARWDVDKAEQRERRQRRERHLSLREEADGMVSVHGRLDPGSAAPIMTWLDATVRAEFTRKRDAGEGPAEPGEAGRIRVDALVDLVRHGMRCNLPGTGASTTVVVRIDTEALGTGLGLGSCDALGVPFTAGQIRRLAVDAQILPVMLGTGSQPLDVGFAKRFFTLAQKTALAERDRGCAFCHRPVSWADTHHIIHWADGGPSNLSNGVLLCTRCHHRIHDDGWEVHATATHVWFTPPGSVDPTRTPRLGGKAALHVELPERHGGGVRATAAPAADHAPSPPS